MVLLKGGAAEGVCCMSMNKVDLTRVTRNYSHPRRSTMNRFQEHHRQLISFAYSCFDRLIFNGFVPSFQHSKRAGTIHWFLRSRRQLGPVNRSCFGKISTAYHEWLTDYAKPAGIDIAEAAPD